MTSLKNVETTVCYRCHQDILPGEGVRLWGDTYEHETCKQEREKEEADRREIGEKDGRVLLTFVPQATRLGQVVSVTTGRDVYTQRVTFKVNGVEYHLMLQRA